ncbi:MAG: restriction endonuclease [Balneola sp.]|jgi:hypothetical protein|nr:restriction endonuclease [Balneola sp.]MBE78112.1 restriction endonuclease [Balneola sp.]|tara:strand:- start:384 stop:1583 length:1200 start_codon:yes stop_codon:yes gene_type:complete
MNRGQLSNYFTSIAVKRLSNVEANLETSNQHEFNGVAQLKKIFGQERVKVSSKFLYLTDENSLIESGFLTWYDARENHPTRSEYRLYFPTNDVTKVAQSSDLLILLKLKDDTFVTIICASESTIESQLIWLFGLSGELDNFDTKVFEDQTDEELSFASKLIIEELGIETVSGNENYLDLILEKFGEEFPSTYEFSSFARSTLPDVSSLDDPDKALVTWIEREELLFKTLEEFKVNKKLEAGFDDVDNFIKYSLSVHNRRKSRIGYALEYHLAKIFDDYELNYAHGKITENRSKPDFIFPSIEDYKKESYPIECLTMLGVKSTCKDRWRQVLSEAARLSMKNLFTLEPSITVNQTDEMRANNLQLILPEDLHSTYDDLQLDYLMKLSEFINLTKEKQDNC